MEAKLIKKGEENYILLLNNPKECDYSLPPLSLKNCQAIEHGYDLGELATEFENKNSDNHYNKGMIKGFIGGFQKALEILGDKKFSEGDMRTAMDRVWNWCEDDQDEDCSSMTELRDKHLQSLQQTEWDVEIECLIDGHEDVGTNTGIPKLDSDGNLILRRNE